MTAPDRDPARPVDRGDAEILALFRRWRAGHWVAARVADDEDKFNAATDRIADIEHQIAEIPVVGLVGFAVKAYLACHHEHRPGYGDDPAGVGLLSKDYVLLDDDATATLDRFANFHCIAAVIRDAARFVPEIADLAGPVINPPADRVAEHAAKVLREIKGR